MATAIADAVVKYIRNLKINTVVDPIVNTSVSSTVLFKVQIASGKNRIATKSYNFKGLKNVERIQIDNYYKYYYGSTTNLSQAKRAQKEAKEKGYNAAFIVAFKNGEKISVSAALKLK